MGNACYAGCKLQNFGKDQYKNEECGPGVKCRLGAKCRMRTAVFLNICALLLQIARYRSPYGLLLAGISCTPRL